MQKKPCVLVTGAATGIGRATAQMFADRGWFVAVADIDEAGVQQVAQTLGAECAMAFVLDVCDVSAWSQVLSGFYQSTGRLDLLVNNAGILAAGAFESIPLAKQHQIIDVNVKGVINGCYSALPWLQQTPQAQVINLASASAIYGQPSLAAYSASKFAVRGFTEALNLEWEALGIRVVDVIPLFVNTAMIKDVDAHAVQSMGVKLSADDVAKVVWKAAHAPRWMPHVHWTVGLDAQIFYRLVGWMPDWVNRSATRWIARQH